MDQTPFEVFCQNKTKMSTIDEPDRYFRLLKDNGLITKEHFDKLEDSEKSVYNVLELIESGGPSLVEKFWGCVRQEHILKRYIQLSELCKILKPLPAVPSYSLRKNTKSGEGSKEQDTGKEKTVKKRKAESSSGPSSQSTQRKTADGVREEEGKKDLWDMPEHKRWLPVTCGEEKALLDRRALRMDKKESIKRGRTMIAPHIFEQIGGKGKNKSWKTSILCQGKSLNTLIKKGILKAPETKRRTVHRK